MHAPAEIAAAAVVARIAQRVREAGVDLPGLGLLGCHSLPPNRGNQVQRALQHRRVPVRVAAPCCPSGAFKWVNDQQTLG